MHVYILSCIFYAKIVSVSIISYTYARDWNRDENLSRETAISVSANQQKQKPTTLVYVAHSTYYYYYTAEYSSLENFPKFARALKLN